MNSLSVLKALYMRKYKVINIILYLFLGIISYNFIYDLTSIKIIKILIFTLISFALSMYISDNYTLSKNIYIKILQKLVFLIFKLSLIVFILEILDISIFNKIHCEPTDFGGSFINSALEDSEIPLVLILNGLNLFNYLEFSCIFSLFFFLFRKYLIKKIKFFYLKLTNKGIESIKDENITLNKAFNTVDKYAEYIILYVFICFFWIKFLHMNISIDLASNIDSYVAVYLILKKNSLLCLFTYNKYNFISPISFQRIKNIFIQRLRLNLYKLK